MRLPIAPRLAAAAQGRQKRGRGRLLAALLLALAAAPAAGGAQTAILPADIRLLEGGEAWTEAFLARPELRLEPAKPRLDRHGRRLAHVFSGALWLQRELVARGLAVVAPPLVSRERARTLLALERRARRSEPGLWRRDGARPVPAERARSALDRFAIVEGVVVATARGFRHRFVNFGEDWREDFTVLLRRGRLSRAFPRGALEGRRVRVRGWVFYRNGPAIELADPLYLEPLGPAGAAADQAASPSR